MPITALDPLTALVVVDLQVGFGSLPTAHPIEDVIGEAARLCRAFRARGLPVVLVNVAGMAPGRTERAPRIADMPAGWTDIVPALDRQPTDHCVTKRTWGAFTNTDLAPLLRDRGATQVVVCGVATSVGVETTARQAYELGFNVTLAIDAMTDISAEAHANSVERIFPRLGETGTAAAIVAHLEDRRS